MTIHRARGLATSLQREKKSGSALHESDDEEGRLRSFELGGRDAASGIWGSVVCRYSGFWHLRDNWGFKCLLGHRRSWN